MLQAIDAGSFDIVREFLDDAAIDWQQSDDGSIYITSLDFNFWIQPLPDGSGYEFFTYWPFCQGVRPDEALSFANECNLELQMIQFSVTSCGSRLQGHYALYVPDGIERRSLIHTARRFAEVFAEAVNSHGAYVLAVSLEPHSRAEFPIALSTKH